VNKPAGRRGLALDLRDTRGYYRVSRERGRSATGESDLMEFTTEQRPDGIQRIVLSGRMDGPGTEQVAARFTETIAAQPPRVVVDMTRVLFLSSIGIRLLLSNAKALKQHRGRMVIAGPQPLVKEVLDIVGIGLLIPVHADLESACAALAASDRAV
jgi:anti-sigma B factor antagonist